MSSQGISRDGVRLAFEDTGAGSPAVVLLHGLSCDRTYFAAQVDHLRTRHRTVAIDLRGHGESGGSDAPASAGQMAEDVAHVCRELGVDRPVLVGHSMGAFIAARVARRHPGLARGLVTLDASVAPPVEALGMLTPLLEGMKGPDPVGAWTQFCDMTLGPAASPALRARVAADCRRMPAAFLREAISAILMEPPGSSLQGLELPVLVVTGLIPLDRALLQTVCPQAQVAAVPGVGHYLTLTAPDAVSAALAPFLASLT
jgi:pimeloyl-ACP methyl ester carboxylesterase